MTRNGNKKDLQLVVERMLDDSIKAEKAEQDPNKAEDTSAGPLVKVTGNNNRITVCLGRLRRWRDSPPMWFDTSII